MTTFDIHPLLIDHVAHEIFTYLPIKDLLSCRLVCKAWHPEATKCFRKIPIPKDGQRTRPLKHFNYYESCRKRDFNSFMEAMSGSSLIPVTKMKLTNPFFHEKNGDLFREFLDKFGHSLEFLDIDIDCEGYELVSTVITDIPFMKVPIDENFKFKGLKVLRISVYGVDGGRRNRHWNPVPFFSRFLNLLLNGSPNLKELKISVDESEDNEESDGWDSEEEYLNWPRDEGPQDTPPRRSKVLTSVVLDSIGKHKNLKKLKIIMDINAERSEKLWEISNLELQCLKIYDTENDSDEWQSKSEGRIDALFSLWQSQAHCLKELKVNRANDGILGRLKFPKVEVLKLRIFEYYETEQRLRLFHILPFFPALRELHLDDVTNLLDESAATSSSIVPATSVNSLHIRNQQIDFYVVNMISHLFPALTYASLSVEIRHGEGNNNGVKILQHMLSTLPKTLEQLHLYVDAYGEVGMLGERMPDAVLTGFETEICKEILEQKDFHREVNEGSGGIANLPNLREFTWDYLDYPVTDVTGYMALMKMPKLRKCEIYEPQFSKECIELLRSHIPELHCECEPYIPTD